MGIIQCAENCRYQKDGYCNLNTCSTVNSLNAKCPHFIDNSADNRQGLPQVARTDKSN